MSQERFFSLIEGMCNSLGLVSSEDVLQQGFLMHRDFEVFVNHYATSDPDALYMGFNFGVVQAGRTLRIYRLLLEANLAVYAQDQAHLGLDGEMSTVRLVVRQPMVSELTGEWLAQSLDHYTEHGLYWRQSLINSPDEMFAGICSGDYQWIRV